MGGGEFLPIAGMAIRAARAPRPVAVHENAPTLRLRPESRYRRSPRERNVNEINHNKANKGCGVEKARNHRAIGHARKAGALDASMLALLRG